ncbi:MAG TPA: type VI secretion system tube protein Hcp [Rhodopila sp.]|uniref:type VI secretion system tube protein Hcp n=1 Tax=Rhodopila sp. TaxID=2480087 RepID=UPI002C9F0DA2|nr:type VI secretion system tube protein Hcp [Rhodopila sp.]HVY16440.1 type VI secretion system tube protein Hcp [Rhodopila sp.]
MDSDSGDLLLKLVQKGGVPVAGTSQTVLTKPGSTPDMLSKDFQRPMYMEIDNFNMRMGTSGTERGAQSQQQAQQQTQQHVHDTHYVTQQMTEEERRASLGAVSRRGGYQSWRSGNLKPGRYPLDLQPITFDKPADISSKVIVQSCIDREMFDQAVIIKRKPTGSVLAGEVYLRLEFDHVMVIKVDWSDEDDYIKETVSFIARAVTLSYRPQTSAGGLGPVISKSWSMTDQRDVS